MVHPVSTQSIGETSDPPSLIRQLANYRLIINLIFIVLYLMANSAVHLTVTLVIGNYLVSRVCTYLKIFQLHRPFVGLVSGKMLVGRNFALSVMYLLTLILKSKWRFVPLCMKCDFVF